MKVGSHNSACYTINWDVSFWSIFSVWEWVRVAAKYIWPIRKVVERLTYTQDKDILRQLGCGVDILDLRVSYSKQGLFYTSHTFCCASLADILAQILYALEYDIVTTPITLLIYPDSRNNTLIGHERHLLQLLTMLLSPYLQKGSLVVYYRATAVNLKKVNLIKNAGDINKVWFNVATPAEFITKYKVESNAFRDGTGIDCVLTPALSITSLYCSVKHMSLQIKHLLRDADLLQCGNMQRYGPAFYMLDYVDMEIVRLVKNIYLE